jgi:hypothetical protein
MTAQQQLLTIAEQIAELLALASNLGAVYNEDMADELLSDITMECELGD